jgi:hypothetical protein
VNAKVDAAAADQEGEHRSQSDQTPPSQPLSSKATSRHMSAQKPKAIPVWPLRYEYEEGTGYPGE